MAFGTTTQKEGSNRLHTMILLLLVTGWLVRARDSVTRVSHTARAGPQVCVWRCTRRTSRARVRASCRRPSIVCVCDTCRTRDHNPQGHTTSKVKSKAKALFTAQEPSSGAKPSITDFYLRMRITQIIPLLDLTQQTTPVRIVACEWRMRCCTCRDPPPWPHAGIGHHIASIAQPRLGR